MFNPDNPYSNHESRDPEGYPKLLEAIQKANDVFIDAIPYDIFVGEDGPYDEDRVLADKARVEKLKGIFKHDALNTDKQFGAKVHEKVGKVFEAIVLDNIDMNAWFGENAQVIIPTEFDDYVNGVDGIIEFEDEKNFIAHLALGFDVATSVTHVDKKIEKTKQNIENGKLTKIDYFFSESQGIKGQKSNVPRVVLLADRKTIREVMDLWVDNKNKSLSKHYLQFQLLEESLLQLKTFREYAKKMEQDKLVDIYTTNIRLLETIFLKKKESLNSQEIQKINQNIGKDLGYQAIQYHLDKLFK